MGWFLVIGSYSTRDKEEHMFLQIEDRCFFPLLLPPIPFPSFIFASVHPPFSLSIFYFSNSFLLYHPGWPVNSHCSHRLPSNTWQLSYFPSAGITGQRCHPRKMVLLNCSNRSVEIYLQIAYLFSMIFSGFKLSYPLIDICLIS